MNINMSHLKKEDIRRLAVEPVRVVAWPHYSLLYVSTMSQYICPVLVVADTLIMGIHLSL